MIRVCFFWHMHQPYYKDLLEGEYRLPWVRLHALKDYYGMVELLEEFPNVRQTFNMVPSLILQIREYAAGTARDPVMDRVFKPAAELDLQERLGALAWLFQANPDHLIARYPRYRQLHATFASAGYAPVKALPMFSTQDFADLQVLSQLAWFDEFYQERDPVIRALAAKGRNYKVEDQRLLKTKNDELLNNVLSVYRKAEDRGQAEITTSPFYHPILPLLCDSDVARESNPHRMAPRRFRHPEDAREQLVRAIDLHEKVFGRRPRGLWPSEGSVSDEALHLAAELGIRWAATDEGVLARTLEVDFSRDDSASPRNRETLYAGYDLETPSGPLRLFFRDHTLSDLIGFVYAAMDPADAARDLVQRIKRSAAGLDSPLVFIILDGENAWEYYPRSGREFLRNLYGALGDDPELRAITASEALEEVPARARLSHIVPGSWINANFDIWSGSPEDHQAWNLLNDARDFFSNRTAGDPNLLPSDVDLAREELLIAEGSDWCWWYGPEHHSANDRDFDQLYRTHLANIYRVLGAAPPVNLAIPIARQTESVFHAPPKAYIHPKVDGRITSYFEWMGAGLYSPEQRLSTMHGRRTYLQHMSYGLDEENFYLRIDFIPEALQKLKQSGAELHLNLRAAPEAPGHGLIARWQRDAPVELSPAGGSEASLLNIFELRVTLPSLGLRDHARFQFQVVLMERGLPVDLLPAEGWLEVEINEPEPD